MDSVCGTAEIDGDPAVVLKERIDPLRRPIGDPRQMIKVLDPEALEIRLHPVALDDLRLALTRVNTMLRNHKRLLGERRRHTADHTAVSRRHTVIDIRLGQLLLQQEKERQKHRAHRPKEIGEREISVFLPIETHNYIEEIARHKDRERRFPPPGTKDLREMLNRHCMFSADELIERLLLLPRENALEHVRRAQSKDLVEKDLLDADAVLRQLVLELAAILPLRTDRIDDELILREPLHEHLHPRGYAAHDVGI